MADSKPSGLLVPFLVAMMMLTGVCNTLLTKYQDIQCVANCDTDHPETFEQPLLQTLQMFVGETGCWLVIFATSLIRRLSKGNHPAEAQYQPVPGSPEENLHYEYTDSQEGEDNDQHTAGDLAQSQTLVDPTNVVAKPAIDGHTNTIERVPLTGWKITILALPAICDICATTLMNAGLLFVAASIYQMTRGALVLFVGLFSVIFLKRHLNAWKWASLFVVVLGVAIVGLAGALEKSNHPPHLPGDTLPGPDSELLAARGLHVVRETMVFVQKEAPTAAQTVIGVVMIAGAQIFTASQFVLEESIMEKYSMEPIRVVGWEGLFGFLVTLAGMGILHVAVGTGYFNAATGFHQVFTNKTIAVTSLLIMISIGGFNYFGLSVTRTLSATARSTIDTCRTLFIWIVSLGLGWETFKWLQVLGFALLVYGTGVFNEVIQTPTIAILRRKRRTSDRTL